jgi:outer membrane protein OmpA-like peptidoglycan-associated protein
MKAFNTSSNIRSEISAMRFKFIIILIVLAILWLSGCTPKNIVVLLPDPDGSVGKITVENRAGSVEIDTPNQATDVRDDQTVPRKPYQIKQEKIDAIFADALAIQPEAPVHFILYFKQNSTALKPESLKKLPDIIGTIKEKNSVNISVVGHADTAGDKNYNLSLSRRRASSVSRQLVDRGVRREYIYTTSHGEENPLVKTGDNVHETLNRRVEVIVR